MKTKSIFMLLLVLFIFPSAGFAADVTLAWDAVDADNLAGYRVYAREAGDSYDYDYPEVEVEDASCTLTGFDEYEAYYFVVRAVDTDGNESGDSNEVYWNPSGTTSDNSSISTDSDTSSEGASGGGGCFISTLMGE